MYSFERLPEPQLPPKDAFYSSLTEEDISQRDYTHAQRVLNHFDTTYFKHYHNFGLLTDVLLLAKVLENFRDLWLRPYGLDSAHNYTSPGLSWRAAFKMTDMKLNLPTDIDQNLFINEGIRGGVVLISHRYARANAPDMENYHASKRNSYIMYLNANNLYGWAMSQPLHTSNFKWFTDKKMEELDVKMVSDDSSSRYILECDFVVKYYLYHLSIYAYFIKCNVSFLCISELPRYFKKFNVSFLCTSEYPDELHDLHKYYLLAPERVQIEENILRDYQIHLLQDEGFSKPPACPEFTRKKELHHSPPQFKVLLGTGIFSCQHQSCFTVWSITMVEKLHQRTLVNVQLRKIILKKISLSCWTTRSLVSPF